LKNIKHYLFILLMLSISFTSFSQEAPSSPTTKSILKSITYEKTEAGLIVHIQVEGNFGSEFFELQSPHRLVCQLTPVSEIMVPAEIEVKLMSVEKIRVGQYEPQTVRIVFDFTEEPVAVEVKTTATGLDVLFSPLAPEKESPPQEITRSEKLSLLQEITTRKEKQHIILNLQISGSFETPKVELVKGNQFICELSPLNSNILPPLPEFRSTGLTQLKLEPINPKTIKLFLQLSRRIDSLKIEKTSSGLLLSFLPATYQVVPTAPRVTRRVVTPPEEKVIYPPFGNTLINLQYGNYFISSEVFTQIYGNRVSLYGGSISKTILRKDNHNFLINLGFSRTSVAGESTVTKEATQFSMSPFSFSVQYMANHPYVIPYINLGGDLVSYKETSDISTTSGSTWGYHLEGGAFFKVPRAEFLMLKIYLKLSKAIARENEVEIDLGGMEFGLGLTFGFDFWKTLTF